MPSAKKKTTRSSAEPRNPAIHIEELQARSQVLDNLALALDRAAFHEVQLNFGRRNGKPIGRASVHSVPRRPATARTLEREPGEPFAVFTCRLLNSVCDAVEQYSMTGHFYPGWADRA